MSAPQATNDGMSEAPNVEGIEGRPAGREVLLMGTCLCEAFFPDAGIAAVDVLEHLGCSVRFPEDQTCCGQPAFNSGDFATGRRVARHAVGVFAGELPVVVPSGSCAAMLMHGSRLQFENEPGEEAAAALGRRTWELCDFIVHGLGVQAWPGRLERRVAIHHSCHTRGTRTGEAIRTLLGSIDGLELVEFGQEEQCCGFGGTFSVTFPHISGAMGSLKLDHVLAARPDQVVSADLGCLMHLGGLSEVEGRRIRRAHVAELLREALGTAGREA